MIALTIQTEELRSERLTTPKVDFSPEISSRSASKSKPAGKQNGAWWRPEWEKVGHGDHVIPSYAEYPKAVRFHGQEIPEQTLIVAHVGLIQRIEGYPELNSRDFLKSLAESLDGWECASEIELWLNAEVEGIKSQREARKRLNKRIALVMSTT